MYRRFFLSHCYVYVLVLPLLVPPRSPHRTPMINLGTFDDVAARVHRSDV
jgi:hypothetical protein